MKTHTTKIIKQCVTCNAVCCVAFCLGFSKRDMFKRIFSKYPKSKAELANYIKGLLILKSIDNTPYGRQIKKRNNLSRFDYLYTCKALAKNGKCLIYKWRPYFCSAYDCGKSSQFAHADTDVKLGLPRLNISQAELTEETIRRTEVFIGDLIFKEEEKFVEVKEECVNE
jgi:Fe-S-cluster containining protein